MSRMLDLETDRLLLRPWQEGDREPLATLNANPLVTRFFPSPCSREQSDQMFVRLQEHFERHGFGIFAAELKKTGELVGFVGLNVPAWTAHFTPCVEIGWRLAASHWRRGLATEGARRICDYAFGTLKLSEIVALTTTVNLPSRGVMEKLEMTRDPADDFDHPSLPVGHPFSRHVLYRLSAKEWL